MVFLIFTHGFLSAFFKVLPFFKGLLVEGHALRSGRLRATRQVKTKLYSTAVPKQLEAPEEPVAVDVVEVSRSQLVRGSVGSIGSMALALAPPSMAHAAAPTWVQYDLNTGETLYDIDFDEKDPNHGFIVGARALFYETKDGGNRWVSRSFANLGKGEDISYRFQTVSVNGDEVWIVGKPPLLLHSKDGGKSWKKVPVSRKLPGEPKVIVSLGPGKAEMATNSGAIYVTENDGKNWSSQVSETIDATLNRVSASGVSGGSYFTGSVKSIKRDASGRYLAVAQKSCEEKRGETSEEEENEQRIKLQENPAASSHDRPPGIDLEKGETKDDPKEEPEEKANEEAKGEAKEAREEVKKEAAEESSSYTSSSTEPETIAVDWHNVVQGGGEEGGSRGELLLHLQQH
eukprot:s2141_g3.t1